MPAISVIIPVYNKEAYVEKALRSVLEQPFEDIEIIAVNDGSTDASLSLIMRLAAEDERVRVIDIPNGGVSKARNVGLAHARGEWIQFLDADDWLEETYLQQAMQLLAENPADILFSGFSMVNERMETVKEVLLPETGVMNQAELCRCFIRHQYENGFFGYISNKLFRRSLWERSGAMFPVGMTLAEDLDFYAKLYPAVEKVVFYTGKSFFYLQTEANYIHNTSIDYASQMQIHLDIQAWFKKSGQYDAHRSILDTKVAEYAYCILFYANEDGKDIAAACRSLLEREDVMACVRLNETKGFPRQVLRCLGRRNLLGIKALFAGRNAIRALYRIVKNHE